MGEGSDKKSGSGPKLALLAIVFGLGVYVGVEFSEEIKGLGDLVRKPADNAPVKPFGVKIERRKVEGGKYEVWLVGKVDGQIVERQVRRDLHTIRDIERQINEGRATIQTGKKIFDRVKGAFESGKE